MQVFTGKVQTYDPRTGKGLIAPEGRGEVVAVDLLSSGGRLLRKDREWCSRRSIARMVFTRARSS